MGWYGHWRLGAGRTAAAQRWAWVVAAVVVMFVGGAAYGEERVRAARLVYGEDRTAVCFSDRFLSEMQQHTTIKAEPRFTAVRAESAALFEHPFAVLTGEGPFGLTEA